MESFFEAAIIFYSLCLWLNPQLFHSNSHSIHLLFNIYFPHSYKPFTRLVFRANKAVEKIKIQKFGNQVGKSVILCQLF